MLEQTFAWTVLFLVSLYCVLTLKTIFYRRKNKIAYAHGDHSDLIRLTRAHANFNEYVPLSLILYHVLRFEYPNPIVYSLLGITLVAGRVIHAVGILHFEKEKKFLSRRVGMTLTLLFLIFTCCYLFLLSF